MGEPVGTALVTGASRGIGKAIALALAERGFTVIGTATTDSGAESITAYLREADNPGRGITLDVSSDESVGAFMQKVEKEFAPPAVLVNNAGITRDNLFLRMKDDEWHSVIETNLNSLFRLCKACVKPMTRARWGRIINISSVVGSSGNPGQVNYAASKAGIEGFTRALAKEIGSRGITVNAIAPGFIDTDMTRELSEQQAQTLLSQIPLGRLGQADEIGSAVAFLASAEAAYITGETLHINGGMYMA